MFHNETNLRCSKSKMYYKLQDGEEGQQEEQTVQQRAIMKKQLLLTGAVFLGAVYLLFQVDLTGPLLRTGHKIVPEKKSSGFLINTKGCRIQDLNPFDESIRKYLHKEEAPQCDPTASGRLVEADTNSLYINRAVLPNYNLTSILDVICTYNEFWRVEQPLSQSNFYKYTVDAVSRFANRSIQIVSRAFITSEEFVRVECHPTRGGEVLYADYFAFPQIHGANVVKKKDRPSAVSVLVIGVDAVSRLNLYRQMPQTVGFLKESLLSFEMFGYNKVGDNTFPNLVAALGGISQTELKKTCWTNVRNVFDNCIFIWEKFKEAGYYTAYAEDSAIIGLFNYIKRGFRKQPTDFYGQLFNLLAENELGSDKRLNTNLCIGKRLNVDVLMEIVKQFSLRLKEYLSFGFFWGTSISHDYLNLPSYGDEAHRTLLETLYREGLFEKTVMVFMSDHGIRWGGIRQTYQGYIEERLPFLFISVPSWFVEAFPIAMNNLRLNSRRLSTPFDLHETLKDLSDLSNLKDENIKLKNLKKEKKRGISLFSTIPEERTCEDAGITPNWCTCHTSKSIKTDSPRVVSSVDAVVSHINNMLKGYAECAHLKLEKILSARQEEVSINQKKEDLKNDILIDYSVSLETVPGSAQFQATVRYHTDTENYTVIEPISRINTYGNQSLCISNYSLKLYCYCHKLWGT